MFVSIQHLHCIQDTDDCEDVDADDGDDGLAENEDASMVII